MLQGKKIGASHMKNKDLKWVRAQLDQETQEEMALAIKDLRSNSGKVTPSKLAAWVIKEFFKKYYNNEKKNMERAFFDKKAYIKKLLAKPYEDDEELSSSLRELLLKVKPARKQKLKHMERDEE